MKQTSLGGIIHPYTFINMRWHPTAAGTFILIITTLIKLYHLNLFNSF